MRCSLLWESPFCRIFLQTWSSSQASSLRRSLRDTSGEGEKPITKLLLRREFKGATCLFDLQRKERTPQLPE